MKAKKGDIVYYSGQWNDLNVRVVREMRVHSWGKKIAKFSAIDPEHGEEMIREQFYLNGGECPVVFATREEAVAHGMRDLEENIETRLGRLQTSFERDISLGRLFTNRDADKVNDFGVNGLRVIEYGDAILEIREKIRNERRGA